jgi:Mg-chelatase subunit ChlD
LITASTTLEYGAQVSHEESNIYGLVTLQAPPTILPSEAGSLSSSRVPIDLVCVVDQSGSMGGQKMALLKQTLVYIVEQMSELDRLAIVSFNSRAFDRSHGLKRMNQQK